MSDEKMVPIKIAILTVSDRLTVCDRRTEADDTSGDALVERLTEE